MKQVCAVLVLILMPLMSAIGMLGWLPSVYLPFVLLSWILASLVLVVAMIHRFAPGNNWASTRQVSLLVTSMTAVMVCTLALLVSWLDLSASAWLLVFIPSLLAFVLLGLWLITTAFGYTDFSYWFFSGFLMLALLLDGSVWYINDSQMPMAPMATGVAQ